LDPRFHALLEFNEHDRDLINADLKHKLLAMEMENDGNVAGAGVEPPQPVLNHPIFLDDDDIGVNIPILFAGFHEQVVAHNLTNHAARSRCCYY
jgi:hypothetical protein